MPKAEAKPTGVNAPATKRDINRLKREAAELWEALTEIECKLNATRENLREYTNELILTPGDLFK